MADEQSTSLNPLPVPPNTYNPILASSVAIGVVLAPSSSVDGEVVPAQANAAGTSLVAGFATRGGSAGERVLCQYGGLLTLTTAEWDAIAGTSGGLARDTQYYLSSATPGYITSVSPSSGGSFVSEVGIALSKTTMLVRPRATLPHAN